MQLRFHKPAALLVVLILLLSSCNLPTGTPAGEQTTGQAQTPDLLATAVAETLALVPTSTLPPVADTVAPEVQLTSTPTLPTPTETPVPTATATAPLEDPAAQLGAPAGEDNLDQGGGFGLNNPYEDDYTKMSVSNGALVVSNTATNGWRGWRVRPPEITNFYLEGTFQTQSCTGSDTYGLVFRAKDFSSGLGYYYGLTCDGNFALSKWTDSGTTSVISATSSSLVLTGAGQTNRLGVWAQGSHLKLYINGKLAAEVDDSAHAKGYYGVYIAGYSGGLTVSLDRISYWNLP